MLDLDSSHRDPYRNWFAANILMHILHNNPRAKEVALKLQEENGI